MVIVKIVLQLVLMDLVLLFVKIMNNMFHMINLSDLQLIFNQRAYLCNFYPFRNCGILRMQWQNDYLSGIPTCEVLIK